MIICGSFYDIDEEFKEIESSNEVQTKLNTHKLTDLRFKPIEENYMGMNDHLKYINNNKINDISNNKGIISNENNIKIIRPKGNKSRKKIYYQIIVL